MKKLLIVMLMTIYGMIFAQQAEEPAGNAQAMVRVAHLDPDTPELEISVDGESSFEVVAFRAVSDYQPVSSGTVNITVLVEGEEVASDSHDFEAGRHYTLVVLSGVAEAVEDAVEEETETVEEPEETPAEAAEEVGEEVPEEETETVEEPEETPEEAAEEVGEEVPEEEAETVEEVEQGLRVLIFTDEVTTPPGEDEALVRVLHAYSPADDETREEGVDFAPFSP
ncbi:MAG: DUF4397 domain-containing protein, partial [Deinococcota bacterium]|nr:DUF4397 domain-containing protein [Deinococcota bacterium]